MEMAIEDFRNFTNQSLILRVRNSNGEPMQAALAAKSLINAQHVKAILGPRTWQEASLVADIGSQLQTPVLSFADSPPWAARRWPFLLQASQSNHAQMNAVASIVQSWGWHNVVVIYEGTDSTATKVIPPLHNSMQKAGLEISHFLALPPFATPLLSEELDKLKKDECKVFVVHTNSLSLAVHLFEVANKMGMMEKGFVWIITEPVTSLVHAMSPSTISSMQGVIGVKSFLLETEPNFRDFHVKFSRKFISEHPEETNYEPGIFAAEAYDVVWAAALAVVGGGKEKDELLDRILLSDFHGLTGKFQFNEGKLPPTKTFQIINIIGKSDCELGFWTDGFGFSKAIDGKVTFNSSMAGLGKVFWPGEHGSTPEGWAGSTSTKRLRVGVPTNAMFNLFLKVVYDPLAKNYSIGGFSIEVFKATVERLPYNLSYELIPFDGSFDALVGNVSTKVFDAAIGGIAITAKRYQEVDFSQPLTDGSLVMVVPVQSHLSNKAWLFLKPFSSTMWLLSISINLYNAFVIWIIEREHHRPELMGSVLHQFGILLGIAATVWLIVAVVITQSYTASLTSMLTVPRMDPTVADIDVLKYNGATVGCTQRSFVFNYLVHALNFSSHRVLEYETPEEIARELRSKRVAAVFLEAPLAKLFLARYCRSFVTAGANYKIGGYGFVFQKGSPLLSDVNVALLEVMDTGTLRRLEDESITTESCIDVESSDVDSLSLNPGSFWVLFMLTGGTSTIAL
ncbi:hypothetical protein NMG60_11037017, partial [Bertholletia excelsa]